MLGDLEQSIEAAREFFRRVSAMKSPHAVSRAYSFIKELESAGFGDVQAVHDFRNELQEAKSEHEKFPQ